MQKWWPISPSIRTPARFRMAERRMFAKSVIGSARFLRMPPSSRLLYYDLGMAADDDGVVEAFSIMRTTGAVEDDLKVLVSKGFVTVLNEDLVAYIVDWSKNNQIRKDRYQPSIYQNLLVQRRERRRTSRPALRSSPRPRWQRFRPMCLNASHPLTRRDFLISMRRKGGWLARPP